MKKDLTEIVFILDRSGSMAYLVSDTIGGFNSMLKKQRAEAGDALVTTVLFDHEVQVLHDRVDIGKVPDMTERDYQVRGCTALIDAIGSTIHHIGQIHKYARPEDIPEHTIFIITTDGMENSSHLYTADEVRGMITKEQEKYGWEFIFLGANIDAVSTAASFGIREENAVDYLADSEGTSLVYESASEAVSNVRKCAAPSRNWREKLDLDFLHRNSKR